MDQRDKDLRYFFIPFKRSENLSKKNDRKLSLPIQGKDKYNEWIFILINFVTRIIYSNFSIINITILIFIYVIINLVVF